MILDKQFQPDKLVMKADAQYASRYGHGLQFVLFDGERIFATDGHVLGSFPVEGNGGGAEAEKPAAIPAGAFTEARKGKTPNAYILVENGTARLPLQQKSYELPKTDAEEGVNLTEALKAVKRILSGITDKAKNEVLADFAINPKLLLALAQSLGTAERVRLRFIDNETILVRPEYGTSGTAPEAEQNGSAAFGVIKTIGKTEFAQPKTEEAE